MTALSSGDGVVGAMSRLFLLMMKATGVRGISADAERLVPVLFEDLATPDTVGKRALCEFAARHIRLFPETTNKRETAHG